MANFRTLLIAGSLLVLLLGAAARATEAGDAVFSKLRSESASLLDIGLLRLKVDMEEVGRQILPDYAVYRELRSGVYYNRRQGRIVSYLSIAEPPENRLPEVCQRRFERMLQLLLAGEPVGVGEDGRYLERLFGDAFGLVGGEAVGEELLAAVEFRVHLRAPASDLAYDQQRVSCMGRLDAEPGELTIEEHS